MTTTLTFKKRTTKHRRAEVAAIIRKRFNRSARLTEDGIRIRHARGDVRVVWLFMFARCFAHIK